MKSTYAVLCLLAGITSYADTYYVRTDGNNGNAGTSDTSGGAWLTIAYAESQMSAGDTVYVGSGTYDERVTINQSGSDGSFINYVANTNAPAITLGFVVSASYIRIIGFEIRHTSTTYQRGIAVTGTSSHIHIIDNYIHDTYWPAVGTDGSSSASSDIIIRGNRMDYLSHPGSLSEGDGAIVNYASGTAHRWLVEYNDISRSADYLNLYGSNSIARNNWLHGTTNSLWITNGMHWDGIQSGSDGAQTYMRHQLYEANLIGDIRDTHAADGIDGHFGIWQDNAGHGDTNCLVRRNVGYETSSGGFAAFATDGMKFVHNTLHAFSMDANGGGIVIYGGEGSVGGFIGNNILASNGQSTDAISVDGGHTATVTNNLGYLSNAEASYISTDNPLFTSTNKLTPDFTISASSPARDAGTTNIIWITSANGSGTSFDVNNGQMLRDGAGLIEGDVITLVGGSTTRVSNISGNTVTVENSVSWTQNQAIVYGTDTTPDVGAIPYGAELLTAAVLTENGNDYTVTTTGDARGVWFYVDGIPVHWVVDPIGGPYEQTIDGGIVTAKAYALWAQSAPVVSASYGGTSVRRITATTVNAGTVKGP